MLYSHIDLWTDGREIWHALRRPGTRDLSMGVLKSWEVDRTIAWARSHNMTISDQRAVPEGQRKFAGLAA